MVFWKRIAALFVDCVFLFIIGKLVGLWFHDLFSAMGVRARVFGYFICLLYSATYNSSVFHGQTPGKMIMRIRVVDRNGMDISLFSSVIRALILVTPFFLDEMLVPGYLSHNKIVLVLRGIFEIGCGLTIIYFFLLNRRTRQSIHDMAVGSYIVRADTAGPVEAKPVAKIHFLMIPVILSGAVFYLTSIYPKYFLSDPIEEAPQMVQSVMALPDVLDARLDARHASKEEKAKSLLVVNVFMKKKPESMANAASEVARLVLTKYSWARSRDFLTVQILYGYDLFFTNQWERSITSHSPSAWELILNPPKPEPGGSLSKRTSALEILAARDKAFQLLKEKKFPELDAYLDGYFKAWEADYHKEMDLYYAFEVFAVHDRTIESYLNEWVSATGSAASYAARAEYFLKMGVFARGGRYASDLTQSQVDEMTEFMIKAGEDAKKALEINDRYLTPRVVMLSVLRTVGEYQEGYMFIMESLEKAPFSFVLRKEYLKTLMPRWGGSHTAMEQFAAAAQTYAGQNPQLKILLGYVNYDKGETLMFSQKNDEAIEHFNKALEYGEYSYYFYRRAQTKLQKSQGRDGIEDLDHAIDLLPIDPDMYQLRAQVKRSKGLENEAVKDAQMAETLEHFETTGLAQKTSEISTIVERNVVSVNQGVTTDTVKELTEAINKDPNDYRSYYLRGVAYAHQNALLEAETDFKRAIDLNSEFVESYKQLDWVLSHDRRWDEIIRYWSQYIKIKPEDPVGYYERGGAYYQKRVWLSAREDAYVACVLGNEQACGFYRKLAWYSYLFLACIVILPMAILIWILQRPD